MQQHATIAPSSAAAIVACPARVQMCYGLPQAEFDGDTKVREEGTACHWVAEQYCTTGAMAPVGTLAPNGVAVTADMQGAARKWRELTGYRTNVQYELCLRVPGVPQSFGTMDCAWHDRDSGEIGVYDLKYGFKHVPVWPNYQLALYAAAVAAYCNMPLDASISVHLGIYQPRDWHAASPWRAVSVTGAQVLELMQQVADAAYQALSPNPQATPGPHCATCVGRFRCQALHHAAHNAASVVAALAPEHPDSLGRMELEHQYLKNQLNLLESYTSGLQLAIEYKLRAGQRGTIYELKQSAGRLEWLPDAAPAVLALADLAGKRDQVQGAPPLCTPTQAKAILGPRVVATLSARSPGTTKLTPLPDPGSIFPQMEQ